MGMKLLIIITRDGISFRLLDLEDQKIKSLLFPFFGKLFHSCGPREGSFNFEIM